jgi:hypothetical protein
VKPEGDAKAPVGVRFARLSTRGLLLGFSAPRAAALGAAVVCAAFALFVGGAKAFALSGLLWAPLVLAASVRVGGRPAIEWAGTVAHYGARQAMGQGQFRSRPSKPRPAGTLGLPGDAAALRLHVDQVSGAAMVHDPHRQTLTVVLAVTHPAFALLDDADRAGRTGRWGRALAALAASGSCACVQVLEATVPDPALGQRAWWQAHRTGAGGWAAEQYEALVEEVSLGSSTHRSTLSLSLDLRRASRAVRAASRGMGGRGLAGAAEVLRRDMASFSESLRLAGLRVSGPLGEAALACMVRDAFDPVAGLDAGSPGANLAHAGPMAVAESWDRLRHDSAWSQVLWVSEWPRISVPADFLHPLVFAPGVRRSLSIFARPVATDAALRQIRREKTEAVSDGAQKARIGQVADLSDAQEYEDLLARERSVIAGHTDVEFTGFVTVTAPSTEELSNAVATISRAAAQACCELRPVYGRQLQAFVSAALPLGRSTF